ncbi:MAG: type 1 glutamine amidotransferase domain-containing protein [Myxococcaceae bacterium]
MARVVITPASEDYDPTEVAIPWLVLSNAGHQVTFATPDGLRPRPDELMLTGEGLDPWAVFPPLRRLRAVGRILGADENARRAHAKLEQEASFSAPRRYSQLTVRDFDALVLPGGHRAHGIRPYLEDLELRRFVAEMFDARKPVGAICHGTVVAARAVSPSTNRSVLFGRKTTSLTWAQEKLAARIGRATRFWDPTYYRTYLEGPGDPEGYRSVQAEVTRALASAQDYRDVARSEPDYALKTDGRHRDSLEDARPAFVVRDGFYISARWPGDAHTFAKTVDAVIHEASAPTIHPTTSHVV